MTGYDLLKEKLKEKYNSSKVNSNEEFIEDIVRILSETDDRIALDIADEKLKKAENSKKEASKTLSEAYRVANSVTAKSIEADEKLKEADAKLKKADEIQELLLECETETARDKIRLANYFIGQVEGCDDVAYIRGLSNILGNSKM